MSATLRAPRKPPDAYWSPRKFWVSATEATSEEWLIEVRKFEPRKRLFRQPKPIDPSYTLYADCHGEWQVMNLVGRNGGNTVFGSSSGTREAVMNFIIGYVAAIEDMKKRKRDQE